MSTLLEWLRDGPLCDLSEKLPIVVYLTRCGPKEREFHPGESIPREFLNAQVVRIWTGKRHRIRSLFVPDPPLDDCICVQLRLREPPEN